MKGIRVLTVICLLALPFSVMAEIEWLSKSYDYGAFKETDGPRSGSVRFVNKGSEATFINSVRPSCGCTGATYTEDMIQPGDTATVSFVYNPAGRPGPFDKTVRVYIGQENELYVLKISGTVIGSPATLEKSYPVETGVLRFHSLTQKTGEIKKGQSRHMFISVYNQGSDTIVPECENHNKALEVKLTPDSLAPGEIGTIGLYLRTDLEESMGPVEYRVKVKTDKRRPDSEECEIKVGTVIVPDTDAMTEEEIENGGRAYLVPEFIDFGECGEEKPMHFEFEILNEGKRALNVARIYSEEASVVIKRSPRKVKPGKRGTVKGTLDISKIPDGPFRMRVEVMTDDALHPIRTANLVGIKGE